MSEDNSLVLNNDFSSEGDFGPLVSTQPTNDKVTPLRTTLIEEVFDISPIVDIPWSPIRDPSSSGCKIHRLFDDFRPVSRKKLFNRHDVEEPSENDAFTVFGNKENNPHESNNESINTLIDEEIRVNEQAKSQASSQTRKLKKSKLELLKEEQVKRLPAPRSLERYGDGELVFNLENRKVASRMETSPVVKSNYFTFKQKIMDQVYNHRKERWTYLEAQMKFNEKEMYEEDAFVELEEDLELSDDSETDQKEDEDEEESIVKQEPAEEDARVNSNEKEDDEDIEVLGGDGNEEEEEEDGEDLDQENDDDDNDEVEEPNTCDTAFINDNSEESELSQDAIIDALKDDGLEEKEESDIRMTQDSENNNENKTDENKNERKKSEKDEPMEESNAKSDNSDIEEEVVKADKKKRPMVVEDDEDEQNEKDIVDLEDLPTEGEEENDDSIDFKESQTKNNKESDDINISEDDENSEDLDITVLKKSKATYSKTVQEFFLREADVSDDGDDIDAEEEAEEGEEDEDNDADVTVIQVSVDAEKEGENEVVHTTDFLLDEAEVSGEDSSDDEDPDDDVNEIIDDEDAEKLDNEEVLDNIQKVYHKKLLDQDKRMLLQLQEKYLEDGDLHSDKKRLKKFRWKTANAAWLDNARDSDSSSGLSDDSDDDDIDVPTFRLKSSLPQINSNTSTSEQMALNPSTSFATSIKPTLTGPSSSITSYLVRDKHLNNILSSKRSDPFDRHRFGIKKLKPIGSQKKSLFDLLKS